jgi:hypothetical protein
VSAAFLYTYNAEHAPAPTKSDIEAQPQSVARAELVTTRVVACALRRRLHGSPDAAAATGGFDGIGSYADRLRGETHFATGSPVTGKYCRHVVHAWDAKFADLVGCVVEDAGGHLDQYYNVDVFTTCLGQLPADPVANVRQAVAASSEVLLVLDSDALALRRLWVLFELFLALNLSKPLRVRCSAPGGFGASVASLKTWEANIDIADWGQAETTRKSDDKRVRGYVERTWEQQGKGTERRLAQLKLLLRREVYGQILIAAVGAGDRTAVAAAIDLGATPEQQDAMGNTAEELAAFGGHTDIEEMLFVRRMCGKTRARLSSFFTPEALIGAHGRATGGASTPAYLLDVGGGGDLGELSTQASSRRGLQFSFSSDSDSDHQTSRGVHASTSVGETAFDEEASRHATASVDEVSDEECLEDSRIQYSEHVAHVRI